MANDMQMPDLFAGEGELFDVLRRKDWSASPLGPVSGWPPEPLGAASICLHSNFQMAVPWGERFIYLYNELKAQQERIARSYQSLRGMYQIAEGLNPAMSELAVADGALDGILDLPGVLGGCIALFDGAGALRLASGALREPEFEHECGALAATDRSSPE